jgi:hypothetical protein
MLSYYTLIRLMMELSSLQPKRSLLLLMKHEIISVRAYFRRAVIGLSR